MITYSNKYLKFGVAYYNESIDKSVHFDILKKNQFEQSGSNATLFHTLLIDLNQNEDTIFENFEKNTRYEINRAKKKDQISILNIDPEKNASLFFDIYDQFAETKNLPFLDKKEINQLIKKKMFIIRMAYSNDEIPLVCHTYIIANGRARLSHSVSLFRDEEAHVDKNLVGRANRFLHWEDILYFKNTGFKTYDLGGIDTNENNTETQSINKFKQSFGGQIVQEFNILEPKSLKGFLYLTLKRLKK